MAVMRKLTELLVMDIAIGISEEKAERFEGFLSDIRIKILPSKKERSKDLNERWENSRFGRPEWITILDNIDRFIEFFL
jgi:hypothetical protein